MATRVHNRVSKSEHAGRKSSAEATCRLLQGINARDNETLIGGFLTAIPCGWRHSALRPSRIAFATNSASVTHFTMRRP